MSWSWRYEKDDGTRIDGRDLASDGGNDRGKENAVMFPTQADAESWLGENWRSLLELGVDQVTLLEDGRAEYGPMSLHPPA